jgi:hypothetical protein
VVRAVQERAADVGATHAQIDPRTRRIVDAGWYPLPGARADAVRVIGLTGAVPARPTPGYLAAPRRLLQDAST